MGGGASKTGGKEDDSDDLQKRDELSGETGSRVSGGSRVSRVSGAALATSAVDSVDSVDSADSADSADSSASAVSTPGAAPAGHTQSAQAAAAILFSATVVVLLLLRYRQRSQKEKPSAKKSVPSNAVAVQELYNSILVLIVYPFEEGSALSSLTTSPVRATILSLFSTAKEPSRLNVAIYDLGDSVFDSVPIELQSSVRVERNMRLKARHASETDARAHLMQSCYSGERFVMTLHWGASLTLQGWDEELIGLFRSALKQAQNPILTGKCGGRDTVPGTAAAAAAATPSRRTGGAAGATFPVITSMSRGGKLAIAYRKTKDDPEDVFECLTWSPSFSFARADAYVGMFVRDSIVGSTGMDVTMHTIKFLSYGFKFFALPFTLAHCAPTQRRPDWRRRRGKRAESASAKLGHRMSMQEIAHVLGVSFARRVVSKRAKAGLTASPSPLEARLKVGSVEASSIAFA